jgi:hypothetical protein
VFRQSKIIKWGAPGRNATQWVNYCCALERQHIILAPYSSRPSLSRNLCIVKISVLLTSFRNLQIPIWWLCTKLYYFKSNTCKMYLSIFQRFIYWRPQAFKHPFQSLQSNEDCSFMGPLNNTKSPNGCPVANAQNRLMAVPSLRQHVPCDSNC